MRCSSVLLATILTTAAAGLAAQTPYPQCSAFGSQPFTTSDVNLCNAAVDGAKIFHPVAGLLVSGGNPVIGGIGTLGGFGHFALTARVNATELKTPDLNYNGSTTIVAQGDKIFAPAPLVEAAVGVFKGVGPSRLLAIDLLGSAQLLPTTQISGLTVDKNARKIGSIALGLGYGARVGVIKGRAIIPSVAVSAMRRSIPKLTFGDIAGGDKYSFSTNLNATNLRAVAGYKLALLAVGAGLGWDKYTGKVDATFQPSGGGTPQSAQTIKLDNSRTMAFLSAALDLPIVKIGAEAGYQFGKNQNLKTTFTGNDPSKSRLFAGAGIRSLDAGGTLFPHLGHPVGAVSERDGLCAVRSAQYHLCAEGRAAGQTNPEENSQAGRKNSALNFLQVPRRQQ